MGDSIDLLEELNWGAEDFPLNEKKSQKSKTTHSRHLKKKSSSSSSSLKSKSKSKRGDETSKKSKSKEVSKGSDVQIVIHCEPTVVKMGETFEGNSSSSVLSEKLSLLEERDKLIRSNQGKPSTLKSASTTRGTCPDMCPEKERIMRELKKLVHPYECSPETNQMDPQLAVKEYSRSSADQDEPLAHELRPQPVLTMTMSYLINKIMCRIDNDSEENLSGWYDFCWDRLRAIRKDIVQQQLCDLETVNIVEQCARFHITCFDRFWGVDITMFDEKINTENLMNCLKILMNMYEDLRKHGVSCPNEPEFNAYMILIKLNSSDLLWEYLNFPLALQQAPEVIEAVKIHTSFNNNVYSQFFKYVTQTTYLNACLMQRFFNQIRVGALEAIVTSYCPPGKISKVSLNHIVKSLKFDHEDDAIMFCEACGLSMLDFSELRISRNKFRRPDLSFKIVTPSWLVMEKRMAFPLAVVGSPYRLPMFEEHAVHNSFLDDKTLSPDALDASDQEEKMLRDDVKRKLLLKATKSLQSDLRIPPPALTPRPPSLSRTSSVCDVASREENIDDDRSDPSDSSESDVYDENETFFEEPLPAPPSINEVQKESKSVEQPVFTFNLSKAFRSPLLKPLEVVSPSVPESVEPIFKTPLMPAPVSSSKRESVEEKSPIKEIKKFKFEVASVSLPPKSPIFKRVSPPISEELTAVSDDDLKMRQEVASKRDLALDKLKGNLRESLKKMSARKIGRLWRDKVRSLKRANPFTPVIHHMNVYDYLSIWGQSLTKQGDNIFSRIKSTNKLTSTVSSLLETDVFDTEHPIVKQIGYKIGETLGTRSLHHALKFGNICQPSPVYWKLVISIPKVDDLESNLGYRLKSWCGEAFFSGQETLVDNVQVMMTSSGVAVFTKVEVVEGFDRLDLATNLSACAFIHVPGWESQFEFQQRLQKLISLKNHPIPIAVLHLSPSPNCLPIDIDGILHQSELLLKSPKNLFESMTQLARHSYFFTSKTEPISFLLERCADKFLDALHESSFNHDGLYLAISDPNSIITLFNDFLEKIKNELVKTYTTNTFGTIEEIRSCLESATDPEKGTNKEKTIEIEKLIHRLKLGSLQWPPNSSCEILRIFKRYCAEANAHQVMSTIIRMINPPDDDDIETSADLRSYLSGLPWLRIMEVIIKQSIRNQNALFSVCYCEKSIKELIASHWWLYTDIVCKKHKPSIVEANDF